MAITNLLATSNVSLFSSFAGKPNHYLGRRLSQTTPRVQTLCSYRETSLKAVKSFMVPEADTSGDSNGI